ncbi:unnamed protein product [Peniophora sp. CBMAI 1063]|nr:unnamed protein product [Peniophora sp. CBMAI 1063]
MSLPDMSPRPNFTVTLVSARSGKDYPLHRARLVCGNTMDAFVPSIAGEAFHVKLARSKEVHSADPLCFKVWVDGRYMQGYAVSPLSDSAVMEGVYDSVGVRPFVFSNIETTEDDDEGHELDVSKLGLIEIRVWRAIVTRDGEQPDQGYYKNVQRHLGPVPKKLDKVGWHGVSLGDYRPHNGLFRTHSAYIDSPSTPYATFRFHYRPLDILLKDRVLAHMDDPLAQSYPLSRKRDRSEDEGIHSDAGVMTPGREKRSKYDHDSEML